MSQIYLDPDNQLYPSSIDPKSRSHPMKALNGSKTMEEETYNVDNFVSTLSNGNPVDNASPPRQNDFGYFDASDDELLEKFPVDFTRIENSSYNPSKKLIQQAQAEVYPDAKMQEDQEALKSLEIESDMDIVNHFSGYDNFLKQDQIYRSHNDVLHPVELYQYHSPIVKALVVPNMKSLGSSYYGNRTEEDGINIVNPQKDFFSEDMKNSFDRPGCDDDFEASPKKKVCLATRIQREDQEHLLLEPKTQATSQTSSQKSDNYKLPSTDSLNPSFMVNNHSQDAFSSFMTEWFNNLNIIPLSMPETPFIQTNYHQPARAPFIVPEIPHKEPGNSSEGPMNPVDMPSDTSISEPQSNSNLSRLSSSNSAPKKVKTTSGKRSCQHYLRDFVSGILKMISSGKIGSFLDEWERLGRVTKQAVISNLQKTKEATTKEERLKNAVKIQPQILKEAMLMLVKEFIRKEKYECWALTVYKPHNSESNHMPHEEYEKEKSRKREGYMNKRDKLCKKFLSCFLG